MPHTKKYSYKGHNTSMNSNYNQQYNNQPANGSNYNYTQQQVLYTNYNDSYPPEEDTFINDNKWVCSGRWLFIIAIISVIINLVIFTHYLLYSGNKDQPLIKGAPDASLVDSTGCCNSINDRLLQLEAYIDYIKREEIPLANRNDNKETSLHKLVGDGKDAPILNDNNKLTISNGKGYHNHTYETIHYEFVLDNKMESWVKYPRDTSIPYMNMNKLLFYNLCCMGQMGEFVCENTGSMLNSKLVKDYESNKQQLKVKISDRSLLGRTCILTFTLDMY